jgi:hypothetical protein
MEANHVDWVGVLQGERMLGWVSREDLDGQSTLAALRPSRFAAWVSPGTPLREALDTIVDSRTLVAVVLDGERYLGMVTIDDIAESMAR